MALLRLINQITWSGDWRHSFGEQIILRNVGAKTLRKSLHLTERVYSVYGETVEIVCKQACVEKKFWTCLLYTLLYTYNGRVTIHNTLTT